MTKRHLFLLAIVFLRCSLAASAAAPATESFSDLPEIAQSRIAAVLASRLSVATKFVMAQLRASDPYPGDFFGSSVAVSGDTVVVGAQGFRSHAGGAYVFVKPEGGWQAMTETAKLTASDWQGQGVGFGGVAISGDTIVAGPDATGFGIYVFIEPQGGWVDMNESATLSTSQDLGTTAFVSVAGDTAAAGYPNAGSYGNQGAVAVFVKPTGGWQNMTQSAILTASDGGPGDQLGLAVAIDGNTIVAGSPFATVNSISWAGAAYVFVKPSTGWADMTQTAKLTPTYSLGGQLGFGVSLSGEVVVADAPGAGTAYIFAEPKSGWNDMTPTAALEPPAGGAYALGAVSISGNVVVAGDLGAPSYPQDYGAIFAFVEPQGGWQTTSSPSAWYQGEPSRGSEMLGYSVAVDGDTIVAGAAGFKTETGAAYVCAPQ